MDDLRERLAMTLICSQVCGRKTACPGCLREADGVINTIHASGHRIVPVEPTEEMVEAGRRHLGSYMRDGVPHDGPLTPAVVYRAMLTAYGQKGE